MVRTKRSRSACARRNGAFGACEISPSRTDSMALNNCSTMCCRYEPIDICSRAVIVLVALMRVFVASGSVSTEYVVPV